MNSAIVFMNVKSFPQEELCFVITYLKRAMDRTMQQFFNLCAARIPRGEQYYSRRSSVGLEYRILRVVDSL